ncbi:MAG: putative sulfate exporter family transporter [Rikenellaceae bacterium]
MLKQVLFLGVAILSIFLSPALALLIGVLLALVIGAQFEGKTSKLASTLLKVAVVGIGFGMNIIESLRTSYEGIIFTVFSVTLVMVAGVLVGRRMGVGRNTRYLIASGTAICGGSAIAAIAPVIRSKSSETSIALAVIFSLNAIAMLIFPPIGQALDLTQDQFGMWAAIAIHDTSAVVGAAKSYGEQALEVATTVKMSRALWIIPLSLISAYMFRNEGVDENGSKPKISIPWFIVLFIIAMIINTLYPLHETLAMVIKEGSHHILSLTLFLIGSTLSFKNIREAGAKPVTLGIALWFLISIVTLGLILFIL